MAKPPRILIVDDEEDLLEMLKFEFEFQGFNVILSTGGDAAFATFQKEPVDVILSDIRMPNGDGISFLKKMKEFAPEIPFFFMSGYSEISEDDAIALGAKAYFVKPFDLPEVVERINKTVNK